jgi:hypothetical protein
MSTSKIELPALNACCFNFSPRNAHFECERIGYHPSSEHISACQPFTPMVKFRPARRPQLQMLWHSGRARWRWSPGAGRELDGLSPWHWPVSHAPWHIVVSCLSLFVGVKPPTLAGLGQLVPASQAVVPAVHVRSPAPPLPFLLIPAPHPPLSAAGLRVVAVSSSQSRLEALLQAADDSSVDPADLLPVCASVQGLRGGWWVPPRPPTCLSLAPPLPSPYQPILCIFLPFVFISLK